MHQQKKRLVELFNAVGVEIDLGIIPEQEALADFLLANDVVPMPCKPGDTVWSKEAEPFEVISVEWFKSMIAHLHCVSKETGKRKTFAVGKKSLNKAFFLSLEEAIESANK